MRNDTTIFNWNHGGAAGDLGQSLVGEWIAVTDGHISFDFQWTATGAPVGGFSFEVSQDKVEAYPLPGSFYPALLGPAGGAGASCADAIETDMGFIRALYTRTGAGAGAVVTGRVTRRR